MKTCIKTFFSLLLLLFLINANSFAQGKHGNKGNKDFNKKGNIKYNNKARIHYKKSVYRPVKIGNYRPAWAHNHYYNRRWIYFPSHHFYYDNWRNVYFYQTNIGWRYGPVLPATFVIINIENEKHYELPEKEDDIDLIYIHNSIHIGN